MINDLGSSTWQTKLLTILDSTNHNRLVIPSLLKCRVEGEQNQMTAEWTIAAQAQTLKLPLDHLTDLFVQL